MNEQRPTTCRDCGCALIYSDEHPYEPREVWEDGLNGLCGDCY